MADAPGQPNIIIKGEFGQQEKVEIDSNRLDQQKETGWEFVQRLAFPASVVELQLQAQSYLFAGSFAVLSLLVLMDLQLWPVVVLSLLALVPGVAVAGWLSETRKAARLFIRYRLLLLFVGGVLGVMPLSVFIQFVKELIDRAGN